MEKKIIVLKNHKYLIIFLIHIFLYAIIRIGVIESFKIDEEKKDQAYKMFGNDNYTRYDDIRDAIYQSSIEMEKYFGLFIIFSCLFISFLFLNYSKKFFAPANILLSIFFLIFISVFFDIIHYGTQFNPVKKDQQFLSFLFFIPYFYLIYKCSIVGLVVDVTSKVKEDQKVKKVSDLNDLDQLLKLNLLNKSEHEKKKKERIEYDIAENIKDSLEFILLKKAHTNAILNDDEFASKTSDLILKKYNEYIEGISASDNTQTKIKVWHKNTYHDNIIGKILVYEISCKNTVLNAVEFNQIFNEDKYFFIKGTYYNSIENLISSKYDINILID